ncbi:MAG: DUF1566 domain-containing protein [Pseudomonadales bacterium]|nr:DUF1566 domain-containing protein [Pseudomonadales bacterium]
MLYKMAGLLLAAMLISACNEVPITPPEALPYVKLDAGGSTLFDQTVTWDPRGSEDVHSQWSCVLDEDTGLVWEVKGNAIDRNVDANSSANTYTWFDIYIDPDDGAKQNSGTEDGGDCTLTVNGCDTKSYVADKNTANPVLCDPDRNESGLSWRMPSQSELGTLVVCTTNKETCEDLSTVFIAKYFFPNTQKTFYWAGNLSPLLTKTAQSIDFRSGKDWDNPKNNAYPVRLVFGPVSDKWKEGL